MQHSYKTFRDQDIQLDGNDYRSCNFINCNMGYSASAPVTLIGNNFDNCRWTFDGAAASTITFMRSLYHNAGEGGRQLIERTFDDIRRAQ